MFCEPYNKPLSDAAASGAPLSHVLQQHLASCDSCRAAFAEEQSLFATIDAGLRASANSEVPATLIPRVHVALNSEPLPQRSFQRWVFAGAVFVGAFVIALIFELKHRETGNPAQTTVIQAPVFPRANEFHSSAAAAEPIIGRPLRRVERAEAVAASPVAPFTAETLVPDEERVAFAKFLTHEQASPATSSVAVVLVPEAPKDLVRIPPVEIASLKVLPLEGSEGSHDEF